jgi:hypothetical protein
VATCIGHYKLVISCMIVTSVIRSTKGKYNKLKYILYPLSMWWHHYLQLIILCNYS